MRGGSRDAFDLILLPITHPRLNEELMKGKFSFAKSNRQFSRIALDQVHEQNNKVIKGQGGASSLLNLQDESALIRWETCGPEVGRIVSEFEDLMEENTDAKSTNSVLKHHEDNENYRLSFLKDVSTLHERIPCNPFEKDQLIPLNNSDDPYEIYIIENLKNMLSTGGESS